MGKIERWGRGAPLFAAVLTAMMIFAGSAFGAKTANITITFDSNGGTLSSSSTKTFAADTEIGTLPTPTRTNYKFLGWYTAKTGGEEVTAASKFSASATIYARWLRTFKVTFNSGATGVKLSVDSVRVDSNTTLAASLWPTDPTRAGFIFDGWYSSASGGTVVPADRVFRADAGIYAHWKPEIYTITFDINAPGVEITTTYGTTGTTETNAGKLTASPPTPAATARPGYTFVGWYKYRDPDDPGTDTAKVTTSTVFTSDLTIYARWKINTYTITCDPNGGIADTTADGSNPMKSAYKISYTVEDDVTLKEPTRVVYTFKGWTGTGVATAERYLTIERGSTGDKTYKANWTPDTSNISFKDEVTDTIIERLSSAGIVSSVPSITKKVDNYTFVGWYRDGDDDTAKVSNKTVFTADETVNARWKPVEYTITCDLNGGTVDTTADGSGPMKTYKIIYTVEDEVTLVAPTRIAYTFVGWVETGKKDTLESVTIELGSTGNKSYKALWEAEFYTITFVAGDGATVTPEEAKTKEGGMLATLPEPVFAGNYFEGWLTEEGDTVKANKTLFNKDAVIHAEWSPIHTITFNPNGGTVYPTTAVTGSGEKLASLPEPSRPGCLFLGWFTEPEGGAQIEEGIPFGDDYIIYAQWATHFTVTFSDPAHGILSAKLDNVPMESGREIPYGKTVIFMAIPDSGYRVSAWVVDGKTVSGNTSNSYVLADVITPSVTVSVSFTDAVSVTSHDRVIPVSTDDDVAAIIPPIPVTERSRSALNDRVTVGPNPVARSLGSVSIFSHGGKISSANLSVYDASGNFVNTVTILRDKKVGAENFQPLQATVGSWDLRDKNGRVVSEGTYLIRGTVKTQNGKSEKVSAVVGVR